MATERVLPDDPDRCKHDLLACRRCGTDRPGRNYHWPHHTLPRYGRRPPTLLPNRADRRRAGQRPTAFRGARRRAAWSGHPLGLPTIGGVTQWPPRPTPNRRRPDSPTSGDARSSTTASRSQ